MQGNRIIVIIIRMSRKLGNDMKSVEDTITISVKKILKWMGKIFQNNCEKKVKVAMTIL